MSGKKRSDQATVLEYGHEPALKNKRRWFMVAVVGVLLIVLGWIGYPMLRPYWNQGRYLWAQYRISHQALPEGIVIYTQDAARIAILRSRPDYREKRVTWEAAYATSLPEAWERKYGIDEFAAKDAAGRVERYQINDTFGWLRTSKGGVDWIVKLDQVNPYVATGNRRMVCLTQAAIRPVGWTAGARAICVSFMSDQVLLEPTDVFTLFAPQGDPADASGVNVAYELNGQRGELNAVVTNGGYVQFKVRNGPARMVKWDWNGD